MRDQSPAQFTLDRLAGLGMTAKYREHLRGRAVPHEGVGLAN
jgi:hypothetical protein